MSRLVLITALSLSLLTPACASVAEPEPSPAALDAPPALDETMTTEEVMELIAREILTVQERLVLLETEQATTEPATREEIRMIAQALVPLYERVAALESQRTAYSDDTHTHPNDHYHGPNDSIYDSGYHSHWGEYAEPDHAHWDYAELDHAHWGYADELHTHRGW